MRDGWNHGRARPAGAPAVARLAAGAGAATLARVQAAMLARVQAAMLAGVVAATLVACGGGGGGAGATAAPDSSSAGGSSGSGGSSGTSLAALQAQLDRCASGQQINQVVGCMQGLYEGRATDNGSLCALRYDERGGVWYSSDRASNRLNLSATSSGAVFHKSAQAASASGYAISWSVGIASGAEMSLHWQDPAEPASAAGLLVKARAAGVPDCLITSAAQVAASSSTATSNQTGRSWDSPTRLDPSGSAGPQIDAGAGGNTAFDAGLADDGRAWIAWAQPDATGRLAVQVVQGQAGAAGQASQWDMPQVLDAQAPLLAGFRPRLAVSANGHAVVAWITERACGADGYEASPAGKTCRYMVATRRLAGSAGAAGSWEAPQVVGASPPSLVHDHQLRINAAGDVVISYVGMAAPGASFTATVLGLRAAGDGAYRRSLLFGMRSAYGFGEPLNTTLATLLDDAGRLVLAGQIQSVGSTGVLGLTGNLATAPEHWAADTGTATGTWFGELATSDGLAAYTQQQDNGARRVLRPEQISFWSAAQQRWLVPEPSTDFAIWGDTRLVGTDTPGGEFLLYGGCRLSRWLAGSWSDTLTTLPEHCGLDRSGGLYAFNRLGDYVGLHWGGHSGQWGHYRRSDNRLLKGAPGTATALAADFALGRASPLFAPADSQLLLNRHGVALAVTASTYTAMPTASQAGTDGAGPLHLWAMFLR